MRSLVAMLAGVVASATLGVDVSQPISLAAAKCLQTDGYSFAVVRGWMSFGAFDTNVKQTVANFWGAGFSHVDVYAFPCRGQSAITQMNSLVSQLASNGVKYGQIWL